MNTALTHKNKAIKDCDKLIDSFCSDLIESQNLMSTAWEKKDTEHTKIYADLVTFYLSEIEKAAKMRKQLIEQKKAILSMLN